MKKWQEIIFSGISNLGIALIVSGVVAIVVEQKEIIGSVMLIVAGIYLFAYSALHAKMIEEN
ncbi:MAG: hypothetical protein ACLFQJ_09915 [Campylobacterales bacterium]